MPQPPESVRPTLEASEVARLRRARDLRRIALALAFVLVALGVAPVLGVREGVVSEEEEGIGFKSYLRGVTVGRATPWELQITEEVSFDGPVAVATTLTMGSRSKDGT